MNKLAEQLGMDVVEIRMRNFFGDDSLASVGARLPGGVTIRRVMEECVAEVNRGQARVDQQRQRDPPHILRGRGFACGFKKRRLWVRIPGTGGGDDRNYTGVRRSSAL